jgi:hypothetical protein
MPTFIEDQSRLYHWMTQSLWQKEMSMDPDNEKELQEFVDGLTEDEKLQILMAAELEEIEKMGKTLEKLKSLPDARVRTTLPGAPVGVVRDKKDRRAQSKRSRISRRKNRG